MSARSLTYRVFVDWGDEGVVDGSDAVTGDVVAAEWRLGFTEPHPSAAPPGEARVILDNGDGRYSPERRAALGQVSPLGKCLRIEVVEDTGGALTTTRLFTGVIERIEVGTADWGALRAVFVALTPDAQLASLPADVPPLTEQRADETLLALLRRLPLRPLHRVGRWVLGVTPYTALNTAALSTAPPLEVAFEAGISHFAYVGTGWHTTAAAFARTLAENERGYLFADRAGGLVFMNRHRALRLSAPTHTFEDSAEAEYAFGDAPRATQVRVTVRPRALGTPASLLWQLNAPQRLPPGPTALSVRFADPAGIAVGALAPFALTYTANTQADGTGAPRLIDGRVAGASLEDARLEFFNANGADVYLQAGASLTGTPLITGAPLRLEARDGEGAARWGERLLDLDLALMSGTREAGDLAQFELLSRREPRGQVRAIRVRADSAPGLVALTLFSRVRVQSAPPAHAADYWIVGEQHHLDPAAALHTIGLLLLPTPSASFWELNARALGAAALAY